MEDSKIRNNEQFLEEIKMRQVVSFCFSEVERLYPDISPEKKEEIVKKFGFTSCLRKSFQKGKRNLLVQEKEFPLQLILINIL